jgi:polyhydroxybutyrate depolymerase
MNLWSAPLLALLAWNADPLTPGNHTRTLKVGSLTRSYIVHVPKSYDPKKPTPVLLAFHGALMNGQMMVAFSGLNQKADEAGFIAVYPTGTGANKTFLVWNAGGVTSLMAKNVDDVTFVRKLLDDLATVVKVDDKRVYATGMSNGAMMTYRLAAELSDRIAAIAPVAGTMVIDKCQPKRPVSVLHFHGTKDTMVPFHRSDKKIVDFIKFRSVEDTIQTWVKLDGCPEKPVITELKSKEGDKTRVTRKVYGPGKDGAEVILYVIDGGGHTWPGRDMAFGLLGLSTRSISANELMWEFFKKHPMKAAPNP